MNVTVIGSGYVGLVGGSNLYDPAVVQGYGFEYYAIGRRT